jgi:hypothetical protein
VSLAVLPDVTRHVQPPVTLQSKFEGLSKSSMSPNLGVMVLFSNSAIVTWRIEDLFYPTITHITYI